MKIDARIDLYGRQGPDPWDDSWGVKLPLDHIICREVDGTPHTVREFIWVWTAYMRNQRKFALSFYYWKQKRGKMALDNLEVSPEREARIRELQFLMTRVIYCGEDNGPRTLDTKLRALCHLARFAEARSCTILNVFTQTHLLDTFGASLADSLVKDWMIWINFLRQLDPETQLGFTLATPKQWKDLERRQKDFCNNRRQHAPLPTRIYAALINNLSAELDDIEAHTPRLLAALREGLVEHEQVRAGKVRIGPALIAKHDLGDYLVRRGFNIELALRALTGAVHEIFHVCKLQIHVFSGMRSDEARTLPYHCIIKKKGRHGRTHSLFAGITTKFNKGRPLRTHWVTTDGEGLRAVRLAQQFASVVYGAVGITPSKSDDHKDKFPLFPSTGYLFWNQRKKALEDQIPTSIVKFDMAKKSLHVRLLPIISEEDIEELAEIDPFRTWDDEPKFSIGQRWPLTTHQLRRSLAVYANASGLVRLSSLRRQLQHITREMSLYYGRGSTFCKNFIANDPENYKQHIAAEWQDGEEEAMMLAFTREVLNSQEPMFGGAGNFYLRQKERGEVMSREDVAKQIKAGIFAYKDGPLGGCTNPNICNRRKGLNLFDVSCATDRCTHLIGKHSKIIRVIQLKRAGMSHLTPGSINHAIEQEELDALERVEQEWRPKNSPGAGAGYA